MLHALVLAAALLCAAAPAHCYPTNLLSAGRGASVSTSAKLEPGSSAEAILSDGPVSKGGFHFAGVEQDRVLVIDLGAEESFDRLQIGSSNAGSDRSARELRVRVSSTPEGPFRTILLARGLGYFQVLRLPRVRARWVKFDFGRGPEGVHVHSVRLYAGYRHPRLAEVTSLLHKRLSRDVPGLQAFHAAADAGDWPKACGLLRAYYAERHPPDAPNPGYDLSRAQGLAEGKLEFAGIARTERVPIDWSYSRTTDWYEHKNFLNRGAPLGVPIDAYYNSGDPKWVRLFRDIFLDWVDANPKPEIPMHADYPTWRTLDSALRADWLVSRFDKATAGGDIDDELWANYLFSIWEHADYLRHDDFDGGNWLAMVSSAVMRMALKFPEFADTKTWLAFGKQSFETNVLRDILPDGKEMEDAPGYVCMAYAGMFGTLRALDEAGIAVDAEVRERMSRVLDFLGAVLQPNGVFPNIGDWGGPIPFDLHEPARYFGREDTRYILTQGREGAPPAAASANFPHGGWSVMRSAYDEQPFENARHLVFKTSSHSHGHLDLLSVTLYAYGRELLIDPGITSYEAADVARYLHTSYHNTVCVDGRSQSGGGGRTEKWFSNDGVDYVVGAHEGYKGITHRRSVLLVKPDYWILRDRITGEGERDCRQNWHFPPDAAIEGDALSGTVRTGYPSGGNLVMVPLEPSSAAASGIDFLVAGNRMGEARDIPAKGWSYARSGALPHEFAVLLYPYTGPEVPAISIRRLAVSGTDAEHVIACEVRCGDRVDLVVISDDGVRAVSAPEVGLECEGEIVIVRQAEGQPPRLAGASIKHASLHGKPIGP